MAKQEQEKIYSIRVDFGSLHKESAAIEDNLDKVNTRLKDMKKAGEVGSQAYSKLKTEQRELKGELKDVTTQIDKQKQENKAAEGSMKQMKATLALMKKEYNELSKEMRENTEVGGKLAEEIKNLNDEIKDNEQNVGQFGRNVGNYKQSVKEAIEETGIWDMRIVALGKSFLANPIVLVISAIVGALTLLWKGFTRSEEGMAKWNKVTAIGSGILNGFMNVVEDVANFLVDGLTKAIESPKDMFISLWDNIKAFGKFLKDEFLRLVSETGAIFQHLADGEFKAAGEAALNAVDAFTNLNPVTLAFKQSAQLAGKAMSELSESIAEGVDNAQKLAEAELALAKAQRQQEETQLRFQILAERQRQIRDDEARSIDERIEANQKLGEILEQQIGTEQNLAQKAVDVANLRLALEGRSQENLDALAEANLKLIEIQERVESQRSEQLVNTNSLLKERKDLLDEIAQKELENSENILAFDEMIRRSKMTDHEREIDDINKKFDAEFQKLQEMEMSKDELRVREQELIDMHERELNTIREEHRQEDIDAAQAAADKKMSIEEQRMRKTQSDMRHMTSFAKGQTHEGTAVFKAAAVAETTMATYDWATKAASSVAKTPYVGPVLAAAAYAAAIASGTMAIQSILAAKRGRLFNLGKFAGGGIPGASYMNVIGGRSHESGGTKFYGEDGSMFEAEAGELIAVVNKHNTAMLSSLSDLNSYGGHGDPFFARGGAFSTFLQAGGFAERAARGRHEEGEVMIEQMARALERMPNPQVEVVEINSAQNRVEVVDNLASA